MDLDKRGSYDETELYAAKLWSDKLDTDLSFFRSETAQRLRAQGGERARVEEAAQAVLTVLTSRGIELSAAQRRLLAETVDLDRLRAWLSDAVTATRASELFVREPACEEAFEEGCAEGYKQGIVEGAAHSVRIVSTARGIELSATQQKRLADTTDLDQLSAWLLRALNATQAGELFD
ncbi:hypothetical protein [Nocardia sp. NPDC058480]|uniref:hypothetical protein n=1 Tax=unclassified Nocardia TaxID=2637762 RepID=UPI0036694278